MSREIKFRAWDKTSKKWAYLDLSKANLNLSFEVNDKNDDSTDLQNWQEYTGLKDKNRVDIYEGDIILDDWSWAKPLVVKYGKQEFADGSYSEACIGWNIFMRDNQKVTTNCPCKVIGNIYENPELLK